MMKVIKYKASYLLSNRIVIGGTLLLLFLLNFNVLIQSGVLISGGGMFNAEVKYQLLFNNYLLVSRGFALLFAIFLGATAIGPDAKNGNLNIILSAYPSRSKFFLGSFIACYGYMLFALLLVEVNILLILVVLEIPFQWSDWISTVIQNPINCLVILTVTSVGSMFLKGFKSVVVGIVGYAYYNVYMFNNIPFLEMSLAFDATKYRNILCHFLPITRVYGESYANESVIEAATLQCILPNIQVYQILYVVIIFIVGCWLFEKKDLV